jgi:hypothetical protein
VYAPVFAVALTENDGTFNTEDPLPTCKNLFVESQDILESVVEEDVDSDSVGVVITGEVRVLFVRVAELSKLTAGAAHFIPRVSAESAVKI